MLEFIQNQKRELLQNHKFHGASNVFKLRQWCKTGSREMASMLQNEKREHC